MSSGNPVFVLPGALKKGPEALAKSLFGSFTLGAGQFCTKPGIVLVPQQAETEAFFTELRAQVEQAQPFTLLTAGIAGVYARETDERAGAVELAAKAGAGAGVGFKAQAKLFSASVEHWVTEPELSEEIFGPDTLLVQCNSADEFVRAAQALEGHLTATILGTDEDLAAHAGLVRVLEQKAGRIIFNAMPTGVEVCHAMEHGGPYPAASDARFTSVGSLAIYRFARPVCFQGFPQALLPEELKDGNPLGIRRLVDGKAE